MWAIKTALFSFGDPRFASDLVRPAEIGLLLPEDPSPAMTACSRCTLLAFVLLLLAFGTGCDTNNPSTPSEELAGVYVFTELRFDPNAQAIADADVLARMDPGRNDVELFGTGRALIRIKLMDEPSDLADADFTVTGSSTIRLVARTEDDQGRLAQILFPGTLNLTLSADGQTLSAQQSTTANLQAFDPKDYAGLTAQPGTLHVELTREAEE